jgi:D-glycero-alpha-D-manno-heptose-7-phosphate kinase
VDGTDVRRVDGSRYALKEERIGGGDVILRARAPLRISFGGGGTDVSPYCDERGGAVLSATVNRYAFASLRPGGHQFQIRSLDYDVSVSLPIDQSVVFDGQLDLAKAVVEWFRSEHEVHEGAEIFLHNDAPPGSGLGSSSALTVALIAAFAEYGRLSLDDYEIAELAYRIERQDAGILGGRQDQYACVFGGFNYIEFERGSAVVNALRIRRETLLELEYSLVFAYVGGLRLSSHIIERQIENYRSAAADPVAAMDELKSLANEMKRALLRGDLGNFGSLLHASWQSKRRMAAGITNERLDAIYEAARAAGALGGKVSGAGGGGFMFFICDPRSRFGVQEAIVAQGAEIVPLSFVTEGVQTWRA